ncbi:MAG: hypothetical protein IKL40_03530 [Clostridia bacterium]|nr:hypothetical protein [Clostridia bacterium]
MRNIKFIICCIICLLLVACICSCDNGEGSGQPSTDAPQTNAPEQTTGESETTGVINPPPNPEKNTGLDDALFIGDSRSHGIKIYSNLEKKGATFFTNVGMSIYNVRNTEVYVTNQGNYKIEQLLTEKKYGKIFLMLGVNEIGYPFNPTVSNYKTFVEDIQKLQPDALIFIQANLKVTKAVSDANIKANWPVNNPMIDTFNEAIKVAADNKKVFYIDINEKFNDGNGNMPTDKAGGDGIHVTANAYVEWASWIEEQTAKIVNEI